MPAQRLGRGRYLVVEDGDPLVAIPVVENGRNVTYYFVDDASSSDILPPTVHDALRLAGAWSDLDWDEMHEALDRIRHESDPISPIDAVLSTKQVMWLPGLASGVRYGRERSAS